MRVPLKVRQVLPTNIRFCTYDFYSSSIRKLNTGVWKRYYKCIHCPYKIRKCLDKNLFSEISAYFEIPPDQIHLCGPPHIEVLDVLDSENDSAEEISEGNFLILYFSDLITLY